MNTMPEATLKALADHGELGTILPADGGDCEEVLARIRQGRASISMPWPPSFRRKGRKSFVKSWNDLMAVIDSKSAALKEAVAR